MATPRYFHPFPNIEYAISANSAGIPNYITIKDYFHLLKVRDDIFRKETLYTEYIVKDGERPDQISYDFYGDEAFYWVLLQINEITDYYNQWALSQLELDSLITRKYQSNEKANLIHHHETTEVKDNKGNVLLHAGLRVPSTFKFSYPPDPAIPGARKVATPISITNRQYEYILNDQKAVIQILQPKYIYDYIREVENYARNIEPQRSFTNLESVYS